MKNVMGIINLGDEYDCLHELTQLRCLASVPFGSKYRLIDFILSNMVNSGVQNIGILTLDKYRSLLDHVGTGSEWDLDRKKDGLFILPPTILSSVGYKGDVQNFYGNLDYLKKSSQEYVIISGSSVVCKMNYTDAVKFHLDTGADVTILYKNTYCAENSSYHHSLELRQDNKVTAINSVTGLGNIKNVSMGTLVIKKSLLIDLIMQAVEEEKFNFMTDIIIANINNLKVYGFPFNGYLAIINSLASYYNSSLSLLKPDIYKELFFQSDPIYTKTKSEPPTKYMEKSNVKNSLLANGCLIEGSIENSIIFNGVKVLHGAIIKNSIILPGCEIGKFSVIENCVLEREVKISEGEIIKGNQFTVFGRRSAV